MVKLKFMSLSEAKIRRAYPKEKIYFLTDEEGLSLKIEPNGRKSWSYRYTSPTTKKRTRIKLGTYPDMSLKQAREAKEQYQNNDYSLAVTETQKVLTFKQVAEEWLIFKTKNSFDDQPRAGVIQLAHICLEKDIYPILADLAFKDVKRLHLVNVIKTIEARQVKEPVKKAYSYLNQIYDYAVAMGYCEFNLAYGLNRIFLNSKIKKNYPFLKAEDLPEFLKRLNCLEVNPIIKKALLFKLLTGVRGGELLLAQEKDFDLENEIWKIPALHIKQFRRKVLLGYNIPDFIVPLSKQSINLLKSVILWSYNEKYLFSSPKIKDKPIHFNTMNMAIRKMGYDSNQLSSHGLRSTFSTILNDSGLFQSAWIEAQLSHSDKNITRSSYNHAEYLNQRKNMMQWWGDYIDQIMKSYHLSM